MVDTKNRAPLDENVAPLLISVMDEAQKSLVVVTPYIDILRWRHVQTAVQLAIQRSIEVTFIVRADQKESVIDDLKWLLANGVKLYLVEGLHAKIYLNENMVVVSSMNLTESSSRNSFEIAIIASEPEPSMSIRRYVREVLMKMGTLVPQAEVQTAPVAPAPTDYAASQSVTGHCIRCGRNLYLEPRKPLCEDCYRSWAEWGNESYQEHFCHVCGSISDVTYARPLCRACYSLHP
jgi:phosphatidylserine/phosphatidylglycerophosphate/cardiolipin synthase-like enzyme